MLLRLEIFGVLAVVALTSAVAFHPSVPAAFSSHSADLAAEPWQNLLPFRLAIVAILLGAGTWALGRASRSPLHRFTQRLAEIREVGDPTQRVNERFDGELARTADEADQLLAQIEELRNELQADDAVLRRTPPADDARIREAYLSNISNSLRSPLHSILSFTAFGIKHTRGEQHRDLLRYFCNIERSANALLRLLEDTLDLSRLEAGCGRFQFAPVRLWLLIEGVDDEFGSRAASRGIRFDCQAPNPYVTVLGDQSRLAQVLRILLENALRFSPDDETIEIHLEALEHHACIRVCDRGPGLPPGETTAIFDKFVQTSKGRDAESGSGLSLAIAREIVTNHGGRIWAENRPGGGTMLAFEIPYKPEGVESDASPDAPSTSETASSSPPPVASTDGAETSAKPRRREASS